MFNVILEIENCTSNISAGVYDAGTYTFTVTANEGYDFLNSSPYLHIKNNRGATYDRELVQTSKTICSLDFEMTDTIESVIIKSYATRSTAIKDKYGFISVFSPSIENLKIIASKRFVKYTTTGSQYIDTAQYLIALFRLYCHVNIADSEHVYFGKYDMGVDCPIVTDDLLILNCGNVEITEKYHNSIDYNNTDIEIYLPFIGFVNLSTNEVMGKIINLKYQVNVINGDALAIISVDENEILTQNCNISFKVPYTLENKEKVYSELDANHNYLNSLQPFLYIKRSILNDNRIKPYNKSSLWGKIGDFTGYSEINDVKLSIQNSYITYNEIAEIKQLLANGIVL